MPNSVIENSRIRRENEKIFVGTLELQEISGVQAASFSYSSQLFNVKTLGSKNQGLVKAYSGPKIGNSSIDSIITSRDFFIGFTGESPTNLFIISEKGSQEASQCFYSGYLVSHSVSCSIGSIPTTSSSFDIYGDVGNIESGDNQIVFDAIKYINTGIPEEIPLKFSAPGSIDVNFGDISLDRVQSFDVEYNISRTHLYGLGESFGASHTPFDCKINFPIEVNISISFEMDAYSGRHLAESLCNDNYQNASIVLKDCEDDSEIVRYSFENLHLMSESFSVDVENNLLVETNYRCWIFE